MAYKSDNSVTIIVAGEDKSGAVLDIVQKHLENLQRKAEDTDRALGGVGGHMVPQMVAASASVRVLDGDFSHLMRAEERFLSMLPGASALMQAAFPAIGVVAVATGIYKAGEAVFNLYEKWINVGDSVRRYDEELSNAADKDWANFDSLETAEERIGSITKEMHGLNMEVDHLKPGIADYAGGLLGGISGLAMLAGDLAGRKQASDKFYADQAKLDAGRLKQLELEHQANVQLIQDDHAIIGARLTGDAEIRNREDEQLKIAKETLDYHRRIADVKNATAKAYNERNPDNPIDLIPQNAGLSDYNEKVRSIVGVSSGEAAKADAERAQKAFGEQVQALVASDRMAEESGKRVTEELTKAWTQMQEEDARSAKLVEQQHEEATKQFIEAEKQKTEAAREAQEERIRAATDEAAAAVREADFEARMGKLSASQKVAAIRAAADQELAAKIDAQQKIAELDGDNPAKVQKDLDEIKEMQAKHDQEMEELAQQAAIKRKQIADEYLHDILDPLMERPKSIEDAFKKMADNILRSLEKVTEAKLTAGIEAGAGGKGGFGGALGSLFSRLTGRGQKASNGGLSTGAGTLPDAITSGLQQGKGAPGGGGVTVNIITQGTPQTVDSSSSSGGNNFEQQIISLVLKDAETLGPMSRGLGGAIQMLGQ